MRLGHQLQKNRRPRPLRTDYLIVCLFSYLPRGLRCALPQAFPWVSPWALLQILLSALPPFLRLHELQQPLYGPEMLFIPCTMTGQGWSSSVDSGVIALFVYLMLLPRIWAWLRTNLTEFNSVLVQIVISVILISLIRQVLFCHPDPHWFWNTGLPGGGSLAILKSNDVKNWIGQLFQKHAALPKSKLRRCSSGDNAPVN
jgi:hypothetical protein